MTYTVSSGSLNSTIPYHTVARPVNVVTYLLTYLLKVIDIDQVYPGLSLIVICTSRCCLQEWVQPDLLYDPDSPMLLGG